MTHKIVVQVKAGSKKGPLVEQDSTGRIIIYVREPAVDGKANSAVVKLLAEYLGAPKTSIQIIRGQKSKTKTVAVDMP